MCRNNLLIHILSTIGAVKSRTWKELVRQGEQVESMLKRLDAEEPCDFQGGDDQDNLTPLTYVKGKDDLAMKTTSFPESSSKQKGKSSDSHFQ